MNLDFVAIIWLHEFNLTKVHVSYKYSFINRVAIKLIPLDNFWYLIMKF